MSDFYRVDDEQTVDADFINGFLGDIDLRLRGLEAQRQDLDAAIQGVNDLAIFRLNEVLTPAMQTLFDAQHLGFLNAPVAGDAVLGLGASIMTIAADRRHVFTPSPWVMLVREDNLDDYAGGRVQSYDQQTGELVVDISFVHGDAGTYGDVSVWGVAGGALSAIENAAQTSADRDAAHVDKLAAAASAASAALSEDAAGDSATDAVAAAAAATSAAALANQWATQTASEVVVGQGYGAKKYAQDAADSAVDAAASAASIAGGPVASINGMTGAVAGVEMTANKGEADGYAALDGSGKVPAAQLPIGSAAAKDASGSDGKVASVHGTIAAGNFARFFDANGTIEDGGKLLPSMYLYFFGDGSDGDVTISSGTTTLSRDMFYNNLTISGTGSITTNGWRIFVKGVLDLSNAPANAIKYNGANGNETALQSRSVGGSHNLFAGEDTSYLPANGGKGGAGQSAAFTLSPIPIRRITTDLVATATIDTLVTTNCVAPILGGGAGAYGDVSPGQGGGVVAIFARTINRGASTVASAIAAKGGNGNSTASAGQYGGGGGGGGWIVVLFETLTGASATNVLDASGGNGGNAGSGAQGGDGGWGGRITLMDLSANTITETTGPAGTNNSGTTGGAGNTFRASL